MPAVGLIIPAIAILSWLFGRPTDLFLLLFFVSFAKIKIPGLPGSLALPQLFMILMIGWALLDAAIGKQKRPFSFERSTDIWPTLFLINVLLIMAVRGTGFAQLGGSTYGGASYVRLLISIMFYFAAVRIRLSSKQVKVLLLLGVLGTLIPVTAELLTAYGGKSFVWLVPFVGDTRDLQQGIATTIGAAGKIERWVTFRELAFALMPVTYLFCRKKITRGILIILMFLLIGLTGYRSEMTRLMLLVVLVSVYFSKTRAKTVVFWGVLGLIGFILLIVVSPLLPLSMQRAISFLPGVSIGTDVVTGTELSSNFRFDMWRDYCIPNVPKYLLIGRGLAHDITGFAWLSAQWYSSSEFFYYMGSYHSGPFTLLLDFGLLGTVSFSLFFLLTIHDSWRTVHQYASHQTSPAALYYGFLTVLLTYEIISFYFIYGDVLVFIRLLIIAIQLRILKKNFLMGEPGAAAAEVGDQRSVVSSSTQQMKTGNRTLVNRWARHRTGARNGPLPSAGR